MGRKREGEREEEDRDRKTLKSQSENVRWTVV